MRGDCGMVEATIRSDINARDKLPPQKSPGSKCAKAEKLLICAHVWHDFNTWMFTLERWAQISGMLGNLTCFCPTASKALISETCQFLWCKGSHRGPFQVTNFMSLAVELRRDNQCIVPNHYHSWPLGLGAQVVHWVLKNTTHMCLSPVSSSGVQRKG